MRQNILILLSLPLILACAESSKTKRDRFFFLGNEAIANQDWDKAIHYFDNALRLDPDYALAYNNRGVAKVNKGYSAEAILDYNEALAIDGTYYKCLGNRAHAYELVRRYDNALKDWTMLSEVFPDSAFLFLSRGLVESRLRVYDSARTSFLQALALNPSDDEARVNMGVLYYYEGNADSARWWLQQAIEQNPSNGHAYNALNQLAISQGALDLAFNYVNQALKLQPDNPYFLNNRGYTFLLIDSLERGIEDINKSILLDADNMWAFRNKGVYYLLGGSPQTALRYFQQVRDSGAFVDDLDTYLGLAYWALDRKEEACQAWTQGTSVRAKKLLEDRCR